MSDKPETYVVAVLLTTGEVDYRMRDQDMAEALTHPRTRLGVLAFYGHYMDRRRVDSAEACPHCGYRGRHESHAAWGFRHARPPVFVCEGIAYRCKEKDPGRLQRALDPWGSPKDETRWEIDPGRLETSALLDNRKVQWILDDWLERNA